MVNKKYVLVIAFLALIALIAMPVSAWTNLASYTSAEHTPRTSESRWFGTNTHRMILNGTALADVTWFHAESNKCRTY